MHRCKDYIVAFGCALSMFALLGILTYVVDDRIFGWKSPDIPGLRHWSPATIVLFIYVYVMYVANEYFMTGRDPSTGAKDSIIVIVHAVIGYLCLFALLGWIVLAGSGRL
jgi:hypothetical protein